MNISKITVFVLALLLPLPLLAQKKKVVKRPPVVVVEEPQEDPRITEMREATQRIVFIDSVVVDKRQFLAAIRLNPETGTLTTYNQFFHTDDRNGYVYLNEMGNKCYFSGENHNGKMQLFTCDKLGKEWSAPQPIDEFGKMFTDANYPFMLTDGTTLYFAAKGAESIGGYDIFVTRYDSEDGQFLKPENIGMPFNSEANDYMYAIDELSQIGYFVTDRRQPKGKVCVYIFIPPTSRRTYNLDTYSDEKLRSLSTIQRIADTWGKNSERKQALERYKAIQSQAKGKVIASDMHFVINDAVTYTSVNQFRDPESRSLYRELTDTRKRLDVLKTQLTKSRAFYGKAKASDKQVLRTEILDDELQQEHLTNDIRRLEKLIRNKENSILNLK